jgi:nitroreductase
MLSDLIRKNRSYRRFCQDVAVSPGDLKSFVEMARLSASARNMQSLKYVISATPSMNARIFPTLAWAGYLKDWPGPEEGERPSAYIVIMNDKSLSNNYYCDDGIAAQSILLAATEKGYGGCMVASVSIKELHRILGLPDHLEILLVIALGRPKETVVIEEVGQDGDIRYWRDADQVHHVPKRSLDELVYKVL